MTGISLDEIRSKYELVTKEQITLVPSAIWKQKRWACFSIGKEWMPSSQYGFILAGPGRSNTGEEIRSAATGTGS